MAPAGERRLPVEQLDSVPLAHSELVTMLEMSGRNDSAVGRFSGNPPLAHLSGAVAVASQPGQGTVRTIDAPRAGENVVALPRDQPWTAAQTILLVEDDDQVRSVFRRILQSSGYLVIEASNGHEALTLAEHFALPIHLLVTDLSMPQLGGLEVARHMRDVHPESKVLLVSGFSEETATAENVDIRYPLLLKPFTAETLLERVRTILGQG